MLIAWIRLYQLRLGTSYLVLYTILFLDIYLCFSCPVTEISSALGYWFSALLYLTSINWRRMLYYMVVVAVLPLFNPLNILKGSHPRFMSYMYIQDFILFLASDLLIFRELP